MTPILTYVQFKLSAFRFHSCAFCSLFGITLWTLSEVTGSPNLGRLASLQSTFVLMRTLVSRRSSNCIHRLLAFTFKKVFLSLFELAESLIFAWNTGRVLSISLSKKRSFYTGFNPVFDQFVATFWLRLAVNDKAVTYTILNSLVELLFLLGFEIEMH